MSRPGDWRCPAPCGNHNFRFRTVCNRCQLPKPEGSECEISRESKGRTRPGDWECCECGNRNFAFRDVCNRCELPRFVTQTLLSASLLDEEDVRPAGSPKSPRIALLADEDRGSDSPSTVGSLDSDTGADAWQWQYHALPWQQQQQQQHVADHAAAGSPGRVGFPGAAYGGSPLGHRPASPTAARGEHGAAVWSTSS